MWPCEESQPLRWSPTSSGLRGDFIAASFGMPDVPRVRLPHPIAGTGSENHRIVAEKVAAEIIDALEMLR